MFAALGLSFGVLVAGLGQAQAWPWLFTIDKSQSKIDFKVTIDLGVTKESDSDSTSIDGTLVAELTPDAAPVETIRITQVDARSTKKNINLSYSFGPFGLLGKAKFTMKNLQILLAPADAGEAAELDDEGNFTQEGNIPTLTGVVVYDVNIVGVKKKDEIDLGNPEDIPEGNEQEPFTIEGNLTWNGDVPVLRFDFAIEEEIQNEEFEGITLLVTANGSVFARGEQMAAPTVPAIAFAPKLTGESSQLRLAWEGGDYILEASADPGFAVAEEIELSDGQTEFVIKPSGDYPQRFFRLRHR